MSDNAHTVTLRQYLEKIIELRFDAYDKATSRDRVTMETRLEKLNELRSEVMQDRSQYVRQDVFGSRTDRTEERLSSLENFRAKAIGVSAVLVLFSGTVGAIIARSFGT
jgi:hypothetical protein